ncbi:MAG: hypothetical protein AAFQ78_00070 [Bacteroidota bacterium]
MHYHSVPFFTEREWAAMSTVTATTRELALLLLPVFLLVRLSYDYACGLMGDAITFKALVRSLYTCVGVLLLLVSYSELLEKLDLVVSAAISALNTDQLIEKMLARRQEELAAAEASSWYFLPSLLGLLKRLVTEWGIPYLRTFLIYLRGYLLIFSTQVGPLALAASLLPGRCGSAFGTWLGMHLSVLCWGITMAILDVSIAIASHQPAGTLEAGVRDWIGTLAFGAMYLLLAPLTSLYLGHLASDAFFDRTKAALASSLPAPHLLLHRARRLLS